MSSTYPGVKKSFNTRGCKIIITFFKTHHNTPWVGQKQKVQKQIFFKLITTPPGWDRSKKCRMMVKAKTSIKRTVNTKHKRDDLKQNRSAKRHSPDEYRDVATAKANQHIPDLLPPSNKHVGVDEHHQFHSVVTNTTPGCDDTDDLRSLCSQVSHIHDQEWSLEKLKSAPADIIRVQGLISHLMLVGLSTTTDATDELNVDSDDPDDSGDELTHAEHTLDILHDQCHAMLKGLQHHLDLLFHHFKYRSHTDHH